MNTSKTLRFQLTVDFDIHLKDGEHLDHKTIQLFKKSVIDHCYNWDDFFYVYHKKYDRDENTTFKVKIKKIVTDLIERGQNHDNSKFEEPELTIFAENTHKLGSTVYGSPEYKELLVEVKPAIDHHYAKNRHHPEHWPNGIEDMNLIDLVEMLADWKAATQRNKDGNIR